MGAIKMHNHPVQRRGIAALLTLIVVTKKGSIYYAILH